LHHVYVQGAHCGQTKAHNLNEGRLLLESLSELSHQLACKY